MITSDTTHILKAYTTLRDNVRGSLLKNKRGFELCGNIQRASQPLTQNWIPTRAIHCVSKATFRNDINEPGTLQEGPFVIKGECLNIPEDKQVVIGQILKGPTKNTVGKTFIVTFNNSDVVQCSTMEEIPFGTVSTRESLVPPWEYLEPVINGTLPKVLCASAGGCYIMENLKSSEDTLTHVQSIFNNLVNIDIVVMVSQTPSVIYRLGANAILVGPPEYEEKLYELQNTLQIPTSVISRKRIPSRTEWQISESLIDVDMMHENNHVSFQQVREGLPSYAVYSQPLVGWQLPERRLALLVDITQDSSNNAKRYQMNFKPWMVRSLHMGVELIVNSVPFAPLRPGETLHNQKDRLERIIREVSKIALSQLSIEGGKISLDRVTNQLAVELGKSLNISALYTSAMSVQIRTDLVISQGESVRLPSGGMAVVPEYACSASSARMSCLTEPLMTAGIRITYIPWSKATQGFLMP